jgi:hypothetical protein
MSGGEHFLFIPITYAHGGEEKEYGPPGGWGVGAFFDGLRACVQKCMRYSGYWISVRNSW